MNTSFPNLADQLTLHARQRPTKIALIQGQRSLTFEQLDEEITKRAAWLQRQNLESDAIVGIALQDTIECVLMLFAVARAGATVLPLDCRWTQVEKRRVAEHFGASLIIVEDGSCIEGWHCQEVNSAWLEILNNSENCVKFVDGERNLILSLSSGTTGRPKGPILSHRHLVNRFYTQWADLGFGSGEQYVNTTPLYFGGGRTFTLSTIYVGGTVTLCPPTYKPYELIEEVERVKGSIMFLVPTQLRRLLECDPASLASLRHLKVLISSGSALSAEERQKIREYICPNFFEYYASTEGGGISVLTPEDQLNHPNSVGRAAFGVEVSIVDDNDQPVPHNVIGRIRYRSRSVAEGFYRDQKASKESFREGWFYPGDLGEVNEEGYIFLKGRSKNVIIRGGINIYPEEIESLLTSHSAVSEAAVVGWPSRQYNEEIAAFVILKENITEESLLSFCKQTLAPYKIPRSIFFINDFPRNSLGKVLRADLIKRLDSIE